MLRETCPSARSDNVPSSGTFFLTQPEDGDVTVHNRRLLYRHVAARLALSVVLSSVPCVAHLAGYDAALPVFAIPGALY